MAQRAASPPPINRHLSKLAPYPPGKPVEEVKREFGLDEVHKLASNENPLGPSPRAIKAMAALAGEMHFYPDGAGYYLKQGIAESIGVKPGELILGNGSDEILVFLAQVYLNRSRGLVTSDYAFVRYRMAADLVGAPVTLVPMRDMAHDLDAIAAAITPKTAMVCLDVPGNPTGTIVSERKLRAFLDRVPEGVLVVLDQAYYEYAIGEKGYPDGLKLRRRYPNLIVTRTFSKAYGLAGLRIGYAVAPEGVVTDLDRVRPPFNANRMAQCAALAALGDAAFLKRSIAANRKALARLAAGYDRLGIRYWPSLANFHLVDVGRDGREVFQALLRRGLVTRPMAGIGLPQYLRISAGTPAQNTLLLKTLKEVLAD